MRNTIVIVGFVLAMLAAAWHGATKEDSTAPQAIQDQTSPSYSTAAPSAEPDSPDRSLHHAAATARIEQLKKQELELEKLAEIQEQSHLSRDLLRQAHQYQWTAILRTNQTAFYALLKQAAKAPGGVVPCTICDGKSYMAFCAICNRVDGKCPTCGGSGQASTGKLCPPCGGTGKCFLCSGSGKMLCAFCDDGMIDVKHPLPPRDIP